MAGIEEVLERLVTDPEFRRSLGEDATAALRGYDLNRADLELLASQLDERAGAVHGVQQRTSKSALFGSAGGGKAGPDGHAVRVTETLNR